MPLEINDNDIFIGKKIRLYRKKMGWGLKALAAKLNISIQQLQKYETSINKISASLIYEIAKIFEIPIGHFFEYTVEEAQAQYKPNFNLLLIEDNIDDEMIIREAIMDFPQKINIYSLRESNKVIEFLNQLKEQPYNKLPDIVFLELHLPKVTGIDILKNIKKDKNFNYIPVIILTNSTNPEEILLSYYLQASSFIIKSCHAAEFKEQIQNVLSYWTQIVELPR